jgi:signal transduction histidine kinase
MVCAALLTPLLRPALELMPSALLAAGVLASAWYGGVRPGLLAYLLMLVASRFVFLPPSEPAGARVFVGLGFFLLVTVLLGWQSSASRRARAALRLLADAGESLARSLDYPTTLATSARLAVPALADGCLVDLLAEDGSLRCAAAAHADPLLENKLRLAAQAQPPAPGARGVAEAVLSGQALAFPRLSDALLKEAVPEEPRRQALRALGARALLIVPLRAHGQTIGALTLLSSRRGRRFGRAQRALADELAGRAALAIENARLYREAREMEEALRRRADQLAAADRNKDEFLAVVAHELRGPLAALRSALEVVRHPGPGAAPAGEPQGIMTRQVDTLARLVDDLLDVAGIAQGKMALRRQPIDLNGPIGSALDTARPLLDARRHTLTVTLPREGLRVEGDPLRLAQVFANLLTNAAKYTEPGGHVWLSAAVEEAAGGARQAVVSVRDSGVGMAPAFLAHAFELFAQGPEALGRSQGGLGIGLALVRRLVELHAGAVEAHSDGPGKGSEFVVRLPLVVGGGRWVVDGEKSAPPPTTRRVLVVDDNRDAAESLALLLRLRGHDVRVAADGPAALAMATEYLPEVVFLDLGLPGMDGHEVGRCLRQRPGLERARVVALTGSGSEDDRSRSRQAGFDGHLVKPVEPDEIDRILGGAG